jgi:hypothetical protein
MASAARPQHLTTTGLERIEADVRSGRLGGTGHAGRQRLPRTPLNARGCGALPPVGWTA